MAVELTPNQARIRKINRLEDAIDRQENLRNPDQGSIDEMLAEINTIESETSVRIERLEARIDEEESRFKPDRERIAAMLAEIHVIECAMGISN